MADKGTKKQRTILKVLQENGGPLTSAQITAQMNALGHEISERTVRFHLIELDRQGLTENLGKQGRRILGRGTRELSAAGAYEKIGFLADKIDRMSCLMTFDLVRREGTVVTNISFLSRDILPSAVPLIKEVFAAGYSMGELVGLVPSGERVGDQIVPANTVGIATVCSVTINGVLFSRGIPTSSKFGGLLEIKHRQPTRFVEIIHYQGTTLDPLEVFIRSGMTDYIGAIRTGNGRIGAGFREIPAEMRSRAADLSQQLSRAGLGAILAIGWPGQPLLEVPVNEGRVPLVVIGGLNPMAILEESGVRIASHALSGFTEYKSLFHFSELDERVRRL